MAAISEEVNPNHVQFIRETLLPSLDAIPAIIHEGTREEFFEDVANIPVMQQAIADLPSNCVLSAESFCAKEITHALYAIQLNKPSSNQPMYVSYRDELGEDMDPPCLAVDEIEESPKYKDVPFQCSDCTFRNAGGWMCKICNAWRPEEQAKMDDNLESKEDTATNPNDDNLESKDEEAKMDDNDGAIDNIDLTMDQDDDDDDLQILPKDTAINPNDQLESAGHRKRHKRKSLPKSLMAEPSTTTSKPGSLSTNWKNDIQESMDQGQYDKSIFYLNNNRNFYK